MSDYIESFGNMQCNTPQIRIKVKNSSSTNTLNTEVLSGSAGLTTKILSDPSSKTAKY